jgi:TonB family protein
MRYFLLVSIALHAALFANWPMRDMPGHTGGPVTLTVLINNDVAPRENSRFRHKETGQARNVTVDIASDHRSSPAPSTPVRMPAVIPEVNSPAKIAEAVTVARDAITEVQETTQTIRTSARTESGSQIRATLRHAFLPYFSYPKLARVKGWQGTVELTVSIDAQGKLTAARIVRSSGYGVLDHAALTSIRHVKLLPDAVQWLDNHGLEINFPVIYQLVDS